MSKSALIQLSMCAVLLGCGNHERVLRIDEAKYAGYLVGKNEEARESGTGIGIEVEGDEISVPKQKQRQEPDTDPMYCIWPRREKCTIDELETRIKQAIARWGISDLGKVPVSVWTYGGCKFGQIASIFDLCSGMELSVLGFFSLGEIEPTADAGPIELPVVQNGVAFDATAKYDNCIKVEIDSACRIVIDGRNELRWEDVGDTDMRLLFSGYLHDRFPDYNSDMIYTRSVCLIFADRNAEASYVSRVAAYAGERCRHVAMVGAGANGHRYIWFTTPAPDLTYWNYGEAW